jgi:hypothetical protein
MLPRVHQQSLSPKFGITRKKLIGKSLDYTGKLIAATAALPIIAGVMDFGFTPPQRLDQATIKQDMGLVAGGSAAAATGGAMLAIGSNMGLGIKKSRKQLASEATSYMLLAQGVGGLLGGVVPLTAGVGQTTIGMVYQSRPATLQGIDFLGKGGIPLALGLTALSYSKKLNSSFRED